MIVPDASAIALTFLDPTKEPRVRAALRELRADPAWLVPAHWHVEVLATVRGLWLGGKLDLATADNATAALLATTVAVAQTGPLLMRMWQLRANLSAYDAGYVAVAESRNATLVTGDARIKNAGVARCEIRVIE